MRADFLSYSAARRPSTSRHAEGVRPQLGVKSHLAQSMIAVVVIVLVGMVIYADSFDVPFVFDGAQMIQFPQIHQLWPPWPYLLETTRPVTYFTFAVNYALHQERVWGYHAVNVAIHIAAACALYAIIRRTLQRDKMAPTYGNVAFPLALAASLLWLVHPLPTQCVTYLYQRSESLMGLFFLLTLLLFIRAQDSTRPWTWYVASIVCCGLGMAAKEVMVVAPLVVLLYDWTFVADTWKAPITQRAKYYVPLFGCWGILLLIMVRQVPDYSEAGVLVVEEVTPVRYALSQPGVIAHYLRLAIWPNELCLDHDWPLAQAPSQIALPLLVIVGLLAATGWCIAGRHPLGFLGGWFFLILAPTSSIAPIKDLAVEHRMYLPLVAVTTLAVVGGYRGWIALVHRLKGHGTSNRRRPPRQSPDDVSVALPAAFLLVLLVTLGWLTVKRIQDYESEQSIWQDTVDKRPNNSRAHVNLGNALFGVGDLAAALDSYTQAIRVKENYATAYNNRGRVYSHLREFDLALKDFDKSVEVDPAYAKAYHNRGNVHLDRNEFHQAIADFSKSIQLEDDAADSYYGRGNAYLQLDKLDLALPDYDMAIQQQNLNPEAFLNRGSVYLKQGRYELAIRDFTRAIEQQPQLGAAYNNRIWCYCRTGRYDLAWDDVDRLRKLGQSVDPRLLKMLQQATKGAR